MEPAWTSVPSEPRNADGPANEGVAGVPRRSRPLTKSGGLPAVVDRHTALSIGLTEEEEMDTYTVICIDGPGKDDDPVPTRCPSLPANRKSAMWSPCTARNIGSSGPSLPVGGTPGERPLSPNEVGPQALHHDSRRYIVPRRRSTSALIRISLATDHAVVDVHMGRCLANCGVSKLSVAHHIAGSPRFCLVTHTETVTRVSGTSFSVDFRVRIPRCSLSGDCRWRSRPCDSLPTERDSRHPTTNNRVRRACIQRQSVAAKLDPSTDCLVRGSTSHRRGTRALTSAPQSHPRKGDRTGADLRRTPHPAKTAITTRPHPAPARSP